MITRESLIFKLAPYWVEGYWQGIDVGDGWLDIVDTLVNDILAIEPDIKIQQIKEKFGGLRFYCSPETDAVGVLIDKAENLAADTCELCGQPGQFGRRAYWYSTRCVTDAPAGWKPVLS